MADPAVPIRFGMQIQLRHHATQMWLKSSGQTSSHPNSSRQPLVVAATKADESTLWLVKPASYHRDGARTGEVVSRGDVIRLENVPTRQNLHSHDHPAPVTPAQQEVSTYGFHGDGDDNDEWIVEVETSRWLAGETVRFIHRLTKKSLHSHAHTAEPALAGGLQEVTCFMGRDINDLWSATVVSDPSADVNQDRNPKASGASAQNEPMRGEMTLGELFNLTEWGKSMDEADRIAFSIGAALALDRSSPAMDSCDALAGYLLTAPPGSGQSEQALARIAWDDFSTTHPDRIVNKDIIQTWRIVLPNEERQAETMRRANPENVRQIKLSAGLQTMLARSVEVATEAGRPQPFSTRHLLACLLGPREWAADPKGAERISNLPLDIPAIRRSFRTWFKQWRKEDFPTVIDELLGVTDADPPLSAQANDVPSRTTFLSGPAGYSSDFCGVGGSARVPDYLQVEAYAHRLADLVSLRETKLPLAIGLFGDWGSGKSHFMNLIDRRLKARSVEEKGRPADARGPWCREIVPIYFNAWHYHDTNLWASLVTEIFDGLFLHLKPKENELKLMQERLVAAGGATAQAEEEVKVAHRSVEAARALAKTAVSNKNDAREALNGVLNSLRSLVPRIVASENRNLVIKWLGIEPEVATLSDLTKRRAEINSVAGRFRELYRRFNAPGRTERIAYLICWVVVFPWLLNLGASYVPTFKAVLEQIGPWVKRAFGFILVVTPWLIAKWREVALVLQEMESLQKEAEEAQKTTGQKQAVAEAQRRLVEAEAAATAAQARLAAAQLRERELSEAAEGLLPGRRMHRFIENRATSPDYRGQLGLVSLARRDFQELSDIFTDAVALEQQKAKLSAEEAANLQRLGDSIDRIVLFVDDLDRCQPEKVVDILQAVHLLLATPLFAVVVGVDQRCLRQSLRTRFRGLLTEERSKHRADADAEDRERPATPLDYLEKIFHIPFHLPGMDERGFGTLVERLTEVNAVDGPNTSLVQPVKSTATVRPNPVTPSQPGAPREGTAQSPASSVQTVGAVAQPARPQQVIGSVPLHEWERRALKDYHSLIRTPRGATRFINTYRLVRAGLPEMEWEAFRGDEALHGEFRLTMLLLAAAAGFPALARKWFALLRNADPGALFISDDIVVGLDANAWAAFKTLYDNTIAKTTPMLTHDLIGKWLDRVERFTF